MREIRPRLTPSHFAVMGDLMRKHDLSPHEAIEQLRTAAEEGASVIALRESVEGEHGNGSPDWERRLDKMVSLAEKIRTDYGVPDRVHKAASAFLKCLESGECNNSE